MSDQQQDAAANPFETAREELALDGIPSAAAGRIPYARQGHLSGIQWPEGAYRA
jgi:hypothetical protein